MKLVTDRTDAIIINAHTFGDIENANYALVSLDTDFIADCRAKVKLCAAIIAAEEAKAKPLRFCKLSFYQNVTIWSADEDLELPGSKKWSYIEITKEEIDKLNNLENFNSNVSVIEFSEKGFRFVDSDDESNEYFTAIINPNEL